MSDSLKILVIDDSEDDRFLYRRSLMKSTRYGFDVVEASSGEEGLARIDAEKFACVLLDYSLPGRDGIEILKRIRARHPFVPVVMLTGLGNEKIAVATIQEGAQNYIPKAHIDAQTLPHVIEVAIRQCEMQSRITEQRRSLDMFARALAHDLKEPVRSIRTLLDVVDAELPSDGKVNDHFQSIRSKAEHMNSLIDTFYFYSRLDDAEPIRREVCGANELVDAAAQNISQLIRDRQAVISCEPLPRVEVNREQMVQVLQNLLSNAIENCASAARIEISAAEHSDYWLFRVRDNGQGIDGSLTENLFMPLKRLSHHERQGPGLGLATCRKIIERHGGQIWFEANPGGGADFLFRIKKTEPAEERATVSDPLVAQVAVRGKTDKRVATLLLVDDDDMSLDLTQVLLIEANRLHCKVLVARDGTEALERLRATDIDLVLLDINMPKMDGFELLEHMRAERMLDRISVVMCSTSTYEEDIARAKQLGAFGYLTKPPNFQRLREILDELASLEIMQRDDAYHLLTVV